MCPPAGPGESSAEATCPLSSTCPPATLSLPWEVQTSRPLPHHCQAMGSLPPAVLWLLLRAQLTEVQWPPTWTSKPGRRAAPRPHSPGSPAADWPSPWAWARELPPPSVSQGSRTALTRVSDTRRAGSVLDQPLPRPCITAPGQRSPSPPGPRRHPCPPVISRCLSCSLCLMPPSWLPCSGAGWAPVPVLAIPSAATGAVGMLSEVRRPGHPPAAHVSSFSHSLLGSDGHSCLGHRATQEHSCLVSSKLGGHTPSPQSTGPCARCCLSPHPPTCPLRPAQCPTHVGEGMTTVS